jgi:Transcription- and export-related complex subunit
MTSCTNLVRSTRIPPVKPLAVYRKLDKQILLLQVEAYPNMVEPYVEALRYLTPLGFDVLTFAIIDRLAGSGVLCTCCWQHDYCTHVAEHA